MPAIEPEVAPSANQPALSVAVQDSEASPVFVSVTELVVALLPKSTVSGETDNWAAVPLVDVGTVIETDTVSEPAPRSPVTFMVVLYLPAASAPRSTESEIVRLEFPHTVPDDAPTDSHPALSLIDQEKALLVEFVIVIEAVVCVLPKST